MKRSSGRKVDHADDLGEEVMESLFAGLRGHSVDLSEDFCERVAQRTIRRPAEPTRVGPLSVVTELVIQAMNSVTQLARLAAGGPPSRGKGSSGGCPSAQSAVSPPGRATRRADR